MITRFIFTIYFWFGFLIITLLGLMLFPLFLTGYFIFVERKPDAAIRWGICIYGWMLVKILPFLAPVTVERRAGTVLDPVIFVSNHNSAIDPYLFGALLQNACFVTSWPFKIPIYGFFMRLAGYINVNDGWKRVGQKCFRMLHEGTSMIIWPEGHRSRDGRMGRFKNGAFALAAETGYPLVPVCILGSGKFLPPGRLLISPTRIKLIILDPIYPEPGNDRQQEIIRLRQQAEKVIRETLEESGELSANHPFHTEVVRGDQC